MKTKVILVTQDTPCVMTFDEVFKRYERLIGKKIWPWSQSYDIDDLYQVASIALWKAYEKYDSDKYPIAFGYVAGKFIDNALIQHNTRNKPKTGLKTSQIQNVVSLEEPTYTAKDGDEVTVGDMIGEDDKFTTQIADKMLVKSMMKRLTAKQREYVGYYLCGYKMKDIAEINGVTLQTVSKRIDDALIRLRTLYIKELLA